MAVAADFYSTKRWPGTPTQNQTIEDGQMIDFAEDLVHGHFRQYGPSHRPGTPIQYTGGPLALALGSPFFKLSQSAHLDHSLPARPFIKYLVYERGHTLASLVQSGMLNVSALLSLDFDLSPTLPNLKRIVSNFIEHFPHWPFTILVSKNSFHGVVENWFPMGDYPNRMGLVIEAISEELPPRRRHIGIQFGQDLQRYSRDNMRLQRWCIEQAGVFCHYDRPEDGKFPHPLDMKNAGATIWNLARYREGRANSVGVLRLNPKHANDPPPYVVNQYRQGRSPRIYPFKENNIQPMLL